MNKKQIKKFNKNVKNKEFKRLLESFKIKNIIDFIIKYNNYFNEKINILSLELKDKLLIEKCYR